MSTLVVYESMFGNTRQLAEAIAAEIPGARAVPVWSVAPSAVAAVDHVVIGGPTHAFAMSRPATRIQAEDLARRKGLTFEPAVDADGIREWLARTDLHGKYVIAFDTRVVKLLPGAARRIQRAAVRAGGSSVAHPASYLVTRNNALRPGELDRARAWGRMLSSVHTQQDVGP